MQWHDFCRAISIFIGPPQMPAPPWAAGICGGPIKVCVALNHVIAIMLVQWWASITDNEPRLIENWLKILCLLKGFNNSHL